MSKWVYTFGNGQAEGDASMRNLLGGKGANLAEMNVVGLPVPPGFTVTTEVCTYYYANNKTYPADLKDQVKAAVAGVEKIMGKKFADAETDETLRRYFFTLQDEAKNNCPDTDSLKELREAEHDMLCRLIQIYFNDETKPVFKRYLTVVCLFPDYVMDMKLLLSILNYYYIFNKKLY